MGDLAHALTDLALAMAIVTCAFWLRPQRGVRTAWMLTFWFAAASAFAGALHHGLLRESYGHISWPVVGVLVVFAISFAFVASAEEVLSARLVRWLAAIRVAGVTAYLVAIGWGEAGLEILLVAESVTMASILTIWLHAWRTGHPKANGMIAAVAANGGAGVVFALPASITESTGLDTVSWSHLAQIPGFVLLCRAIPARRDPRRGPARGVAAPLGKRPGARAAVARRLRLVVRGR